MFVGEAIPSLTRSPNLEVLECRYTNRRVKPEDLLQYIPKYNANDRRRALPFYYNSYEPGISAVVCSTLNY